MFSLSRILRWMLWGACSLGVLLSTALADYIKGASYFAQKKYAEAIREYEEELKRDPGYAQGHYILGLCYARLGQHGKAIEAFQKARELSPRDFSIALALAESFFNAQQYEPLFEALKQAESAAQTPEELEKLRFLRGTALFNQKKYEEAARDLLELAAKSKSPDANVKAQLGIIYFHQRKFDEAAAQLTAALEAKPDDEPLSLYLGESWLAKAANVPPPARTKLYRDALAIAERILNRHAQSFEAADLGGRASLLLQQYAQASALFEKAVALRPSAPTITYFNLGQAQMAAGRFADAEVTLKKVAEAMSGDAAVYNALGFVLERQNKLADALAAYEKAAASGSTPEIQRSIERVKAKLKPSAFVRGPQE